MTSWIQNHILLELTRNATRRYTDLKPPDIEGNLFMYHLKGLVSDGLIEKSDDGYRLTAKGKQFAGTLSLKTGKTRVQPKILNTIVCTNEAGEYLFARWNRQPNIGQVSFVHGMMHFGESVFDMVALELAEKAGLEADFTHLGDVYIRGIAGDDVDRHMLVHVFRATNVRPGGQNELRPDVSEPLWAKLDEFKADQFVPGFYEIAQLALAHPDGFSLQEIKVAINES